MTSVELIDSIFKERLLDSVKRFHDWNVYCAWTRLSRDVQDAQEMSGLLRLCTCVLDLRLSLDGEEEEDTSAVPVVGPWGRRASEELFVSVAAGPVKTTSQPRLCHTQQLCEFYSRLLSKSQSELFKVEFMNVHGYRECALAIFDGPVLDSIKCGLERRWYMLWHLAGPLLQGRYRPSRPPAEVLSERLPEDAVKKMHWLWYRLPGARFRAKYAQRAMTWLDVNPELEYHLWTDMASVEEFHDFMADSPAELRDRIVLHTRSDLQETVRAFLSKRAITKGKGVDIDKKRKKDTKFDLSMLWRVLETRDPYDMMIKTDILRVIVVAQHGGFYADMNDCIALQPLRFVYSSSCMPSMPSLLVGSDSKASDINNYFFYAAPEAPLLMRALDRMLDNVEHVHYALHGMYKDSIPLYVSCLKAFWKRLVSTETTTTVLLDVLGDAYRGTFVPQAARLVQSRPVHVKFVFIDALYPDHLKVLSWLLDKVCGGLSPSREKATLQRVYDGLRSNYTSAAEMSLGERKTRYYAQNYDPTFVLDESCQMQAAKKVLFGELDRMFASSCAEFRRFFTNQSQGLSMIYTNLGLVINHLHRDQNTGSHLSEATAQEKEISVMPNCYLYRSISLLTTVSHIGTGSAAGDGNSEDHGVL